MMISLLQLKVIIKDYLQCNKIKIYLKKLAIYKEIHKKDHSHLLNNKDHK
jgi:hypothetical protein